MSWQWYWTLYRAELEAEKAAREEAETHAALLTEEKELESRRRKELEDIKFELEQLLEEEKGQNIEGIKEFEKIKALEEK